jgi:hypothetical protein
MIQVVKRASVGPTGWATIASGPRERVNVNSRGCVELIRASTRINDRMQGPYDGWCCCLPSPRSAAVPLNGVLVDVEILAAAWRWRVWITNRLVRVARYDDAGGDVAFDFDMVSPHYQRIDAGWA